jgi:16S rRNA (cytosine1402-N4)-methyltransferase
MMPGVTNASYHIPVLLQPAISYLVTSTSGIYVDATLGGGGHTEFLLASFPQAHVIGIDLDEKAIEYTRQRLGAYESRLKVFRANFRELKSILFRAKVYTVDGFLFDLGVSSYQVDNPEKGFSYRFDAALDMRMDTTQQQSAATVINTYSQDQLENIFRSYGEDPLARRIARAVVRAREKKRIVTTGDLADVIRSVTRGMNAMKTLSRIFQAIRIEVNDELGSLQQSLHDCVSLLRAGGRVVVISYHSLEDRIVKHVFQELSATTRRSTHRLIADQSVEPKMRILTKRPITPEPMEIASNRRARSAKLRAAERL